MAVASLGSLTVDLVANTAGFERAMTRAERAMQRQEKAADRLTASIDPVSGAMQRLTAQQIKLDELWKKKFIPDGEYKRLSGILAENEKALQRTGAQITKTNAAFAVGGMSAKQLANNLRGVPAQFTDIATSIAAGQNPLTVFLQQGGQLKDMFGGVGPAAKALGGYVAGLVNPFTVAAAAAAILALAYKQGSDEATAFTKALVLSGNAAGANADQLATQAEAVSQSVGTVGAAAAVLTQLAGSSRIPAESFDMIAIAALKMQEATGKAAEETVKDFEKIAKDPVKAIRELNDAMNFLTTSQYAQIEALQRQGDAQGAATLAEQIYAEALTARANKIVENLGYVESAWLTVKNASKSAWDAILDVGREGTLEQKLKTLNALLGSIKEADATNSGPFGFAVPSDDLRREQTEKDITDLLLQQDESRKRAAATANIVAQDRKGIAAVEALNKSLDETAPKVDKLAKRYTEIDKQVAAAAARGVQYSEAQISQLRKAAEEQFKAANVPAAKKAPAVRAVREDAGQKMLDNLRQQAAALQLQSETGEKLGAQAQALAKFQQEIADIKSKDIQTADQKSLLASEALLTAQLKRNVALEQEIAARKQATEEASKLAAFEENQASKLSAAQEGIDAQLAGLGQGEKLRERLQEDLQIRKEYQTEVDRLNKQLNTGQISEDLYQQETDILKETLDKRLVMQQEYYAQIDEAQGNFFLGASEAWANWAEEAENFSAIGAEFVTGTLDTLSAGLADTFMSILDGTKSVGDAFADLGMMMVKAVVGALVEMAAQWLVYQAVQLLVGSTSSAASMAQAAITGTAIATAYAPAAAMASLASFGANSIPATAAILSTTAIAEGVALAGMAHDGIDSVPQDGTWLLQKGERVTTAQTSAKLDKTLNDMQGGGSGGVTVNVIESRDKAGTQEKRTDADGKQWIDLFVADIAGDGPASRSMQQAFGMSRQGR